MNKICLATILAFSAPAFAQDKPEHVEVTASRIPTTSFGVIDTAGSSMEPGMGCAEPNCGALPKEPGGGYLTQAQKDKNNKQAKDKAKQPKNQGKVAENMKTDRTIKEWIFGWLNGLSVDAGATGWFKVTVPGGTTVEGGGCAQYHSKLNPGSAEAKDYCVERKFDTETVKKVNGKYETQLYVSYRIYDTCYWEKTCGVEEIIFVAGSVDEFRSFLNETIGENYY